MKILLLSSFFSQLQFLVIVMPILGFLLDRIKGFTITRSMKFTSSIRRTTSSSLSFSTRSSSIPLVGKIHQGGSYSAHHIRLLHSIHRDKISSDNKWRGFSIRYASSIRQTADDDDLENKNKKTKTKNKSSNKKIVVKEITPEKIEKLAAAFDELARKDGFDTSMSHIADDATFDDDFVFDDDDDDDVFNDDDDDENEFLSDGVIFDKEMGFRSKNGNNIMRNIDLDAESTDRLTCFDPDSTADMDHEDDEDYIDFGGDDDDDMEARIAQAKRDMVSGRVSVPDQLDQFASHMSEDDMKILGFQSEKDLFENDETRRKSRYTLISNAMSCSACGSDFQSRDENKPGYLPRDKFDIQVKLSKIEEMQLLKEKAETSEWTPEDEIEYLLQTSGKSPANSNDDTEDAANIDIDAMAQEMGLDLAVLSSKKVICKRCHGLQNFGKVDNSLRPGWTDEPTMSQEQFRELLRPISEKPAVIVALIDLFDFSGSVLRELDGIAGDNPVILAANKADLLPSQMGKQRIENWVRRELEYMGVKSIANIGGAVRLVSCKTGDGVPEMMMKARELAEKIDGDVYVVGAANAGKSTLINFILSRDQDKPVGKIRAGNRNQLKGALTTSPLPGTTLKFIKIDLGEGRSLYDTPGLLVPGTITQLLTPEELKIVCPKKKVEPITFRVASGKCVLVGGLARIEVVGDTKPFLFTFFVANDIKLHPTDSSRADDFVRNHAGELLTPPLAPGEKRLKELGEFEPHVVEIDGAGWREAAADITLTGLGWVAVTGAGRAKVKISVPKGIGISIRPPLMPFDIWEVAAKYTGSRAVRKSTKSKSGKRRKGVGRG